MMLWQCLNPMKKYTDIVVLKDLYSSLESRNSWSAFWPYWVASGRQIIKYRGIGLTLRPGRIKYFLKHLVFIGEKCYGHWFTNVEWFYQAADDLKDKFGKPTEIWHSSLFEQFQTASFIPVFCMLSKFLYALFEDRSKKIDGYYYCAKFFPCLLVIYLEDIKKG